MGRSGVRAARRAFRGAAGCAAIAVALCCAANAYAAPTVSLEPAFSPGAHLGEPTALTAELKFAGTEYGGFPEPLTRVILRLPAGTVLSSEGFPTCPPQVLEQKGPAGCPAGSKAGPAGSFNAIVAFGNERVTENGTTETFFTEGGGVLVYFLGTSTVALELISRGVFEPASAPFGPAVNFEVPLIQTVPGAPDASLTALTIGLGAFIKRGGHETGSVTVPEACPKGALSWRADATFNDETGLHEMTAHAEAETTCPAAGKSSAGSGEEAKRKAEEEAAAKKKAEEEAAKKHQEEQAAATKRQEEEAATKRQEQPPAPLLARRQTTRATSGTATVRLNGTSTFSPLSGSISIPDGSEVDATAGRVLITAATPTGKTVTAEVYGGRFRVHQDSSGETHLILTLPLTACPRVPLPHGSAASVAKHSSGAKSRRLWVSDTGGSWGTNGRYVSTTVQGTTWLTLDECTRSQVKVTAGKVKVLDLARRKTKTVSAGHTYIAAAQRRRHA